MMNDILTLFSTLLSAVARVVLWTVSAALAALLLGLALLVLTAGALWALVRGQRPSAPIMAGQFQRYAAERVWRGAMGKHGSARSSSQDVVDVEAREVPPAAPDGQPAPTLPPHTRQD